MGEESLSAVRFFFLRRKEEGLESGWSGVEPSEASFREVERKCSELRGRAKFWRGDARGRSAERLRAWDLIW